MEPSGATAGSWPSATFFASAEADAIQISCFAPAGSLVGLGISPRLLGLPPRVKNSAELSGFHAMPSISWPSSVVNFVHGMPLNSGARATQTLRAPCKYCTQATASWRGEATRSLEKGALSTCSSVKKDEAAKIGTATKKKTQRHMFTDSSERTKDRINYAWIVAAVTFVILLVSAGVRSTPSLFMVPMEKEFGWSRAFISSAVAVNLLLYGLIGPFAAGLINRWGMRRTCSAAAALVAAGVLLASQLKAQWQLVALWGFVVGAGTGGTSMVLAAIVSSRWFHARRGMVLGALSAANATGQLIFLPLLARVVEGVGWRSACLVIGVVAVAMALLVWIFMRDSPESMGVRPYGWAGVAQSAVRPAMKSFEALAFAIRRREFWLLAATFFICGASTNGLVGTHLIPACHDSGVTEVRAAGLLALMGIFDIAGTTGSGWLTDRFSPRVLLAIYYGLRGLSLAALPAVLAGGDTPLLTYFGVFYGLDWIATVPPTVRLTSDAFGKENTGVIYGWIGASHQVGASLAAFGAGSVRTFMGDYRLAFLTASVLCIVASIAFMTGVGQRVNREIVAEQAPA